MRRNSTLSVEAASNLALRALTFLASETDQLARFLTLTGLTAEDLKENIAKRHLHRAVLAHLMQDESLLLTFCATEAVDPADIAPACRVLDVPEDFGP